MDFRMSVRSDRGNRETSRERYAHLPIKALRRSVCDHSMTGFPSSPIPRSRCAGINVSVPKCVLRLKIFNVYYKFRVVYCTTQTCSSLSIPISAYMLPSFLGSVCVCMPLF